MAELREFQTGKRPVVVTPAEEATREWVEQFVVRHGLCPFAARPLRAGKVAFVASPAADFEACYDFARSQVQELLGRETVETTLLIFPNALADFADFLDFVATLEEALELSGVAETLQLAHFHPNYTFADVDADDPGNLTNRSPHPVVQLLRVSSVTEAVKAYPEVDQIPNRNVALLRRWYDTGAL